MSISSAKIALIASAGAGGDSYFISYIQPSSYATEARSGTTLIHSSGKVYAAFGYEQSTNDYVLLWEMEQDGTYSTHRKITSATGKNPRVGAIVETSDGNIALAFDDKGSNNIKYGSGNPSSYLAVYNTSSNFAPVNVTFGGTSYQNIKFNQSTGGSSGQNVVRTLLADGTDLYVGSAFAYDGTYLESSFSKLSGYTGGGTVTQSWKQNHRYDSYYLGHPWGLALSDNKTYLVSAGIGCDTTNYYDALGYIHSMNASTGSGTSTFFSLFNTGSNEYPRTDLSNNVYGNENIVKGLGLAKIGANTFVSGYCTQAGELMLYKATLNESTGTFTGTAKRVTSSTGLFQPAAIAGNEDGNIYVVGCHSGNNKNYVMQINSSLTSVLGAFEWYCMEETTYSQTQSTQYTMSCSETAVTIPFFQWTEYSYRGGMGVLKLPIDFTTVPSSTILTLDNGYRIRLQTANHGTVTFNNETPDTTKIIDGGYTPDAVTGVNNTTVTTESININDTIPVEPI